MSDRLILVGRIAGAVGVRGEVRGTRLTADPMAHAGYRDLRRADGTPAPALSAARPVKGGLVARASGVETREQAEALRGLKLHVLRDALPAPEDDEFYLADLVGLKVETADGHVLGVVRGVQDFGAGDLLEVKPDAGASFWLPFTREVVPEVDLAGGRILAVPPAETE
ncbi:MAG: ribosome maturation factor RimM [Phenylobacterium sp.]